MAHSQPKIAYNGFRSSAPFQGHERTSVGLPAALVRLVCLLSLAFPLVGAAERPCEEWQAEFVSVEGRVEIKTAQGWQPAKHGTAVCTGDSVRVRSYGRAAIRLPDKTVLRLDQKTSLTFSEPADDTGSWVDLVRGIIHVISRDPRALRFNTPYANAGLEGTEFVIEVSEEQTDVTVLEGEVLLSNSAGAVGVPSGQRGFARRAQTPAAEPVPDPIRAVQWTPYYAPLLRGPLPRPEQEPGPADAGTASFYSRRAAARLSVGRIDEAQDDLRQALALDPRHGDAFAVEAIAALSSKKTTEALALARRAVDVSPNAPAPWLSLSYALQATFDIDAAVASAEKAIAAAPEAAFSWARLAELQLAAGAHDRARDSAQHAVALSSDSPHARTVLGFAQLAGGTADEAETAFRAAIGLDPTAPLSRLGLGLALVRQGLLRDAREQLEIAVVLDPTKSLSRSYMAKIYDAEQRGALSESQLELAKGLSTQDPTPWFYDALRKQQQNRPVEALRDLQAAIDLNDSRGVYRSRLLVDEDLAARSAGVGRLHRTLGFEQLALLEGWKSVGADPADYSGHRLLADVYSYLPRHQIARVNELYQSQLLQPLNVTPIRPQLAEANLFILDTAGPSALAFDEFRPLVRENGLSYEGSAVVAAHGTQGADVAVAGLHDRVSYSVGHFDFETDGFRPNNDLDQQVTNAFVQFRPNHETTLLTELRSTDIEKGDLRLLFDPAAFSNSQRQNESFDSLRLGMRRDLSAGGTLIASIAAEDAHAEIGIDNASFLSTERSGYTADIAHLSRRGPWQLTAGARFLRLEQDNIVGETPSLSILSLAATTMAGTEHQDLKYSSGYAYANLALGDDVTAVVGGSIDRLSGQDFHRDRFNPKAGLIWEASSRTTVRAAAFRTLQGPFVSKFNIQPSLEPTQVAGFNQQYFGSEGEVAWRYGAALDHRFSDALYAGAELSRRDLEVPLSTVPPGSSTPALYLADVQESSRRGYVYWTPSDTISVSATYQYEQFDNGNFVLADGLTRVRTHRLPLEISYFHRSGFSAGVTATYVDQAGDFSPMSFGPDVATEHGEDRFWVTDLSLSYRLPGWRGQVSLNVHNLFDERFRFQDTDPENPRLLPERMVLLKMTLSY